MEGFKKIAKMQCFKEGGTVQRKIANFEKRERKTEEKDDVAQDKKIVKKAFSIHDKQLHETEKTDLSKLKTGGRPKKEKGTVKKYKTGGTVENQYAAKKTDKDIQDIANAKRQKPQMLCGGKSVKKMADGRLTGAMSDTDAKLLELEKQRNLEKMARAKKYLGPSQQSELIKQSPAAAGLSAGAMAGVQPPATMPPVDQMGSATGPAMKKGGKAKKGCK